MNTRLLRRVAKHISEEPRRFIMGAGLVFAREDGTVHDDLRVGLEKIDVTVRPPCGTAACIAGTAVWLTDKPSRNDATKDWRSGVYGFPWTDIRQRATELLGLNYSQSQKLFHVRGWAPQFRARFMKAKTQRGRVNAAIGQIEHFIKTKGKE